METLTHYIKSNSDCYNLFQYKLIHLYIYLLLNRLCDNISYSKLFIYKHFPDRFILTKQTKNITSYQPFFCIKTIQFITSR